MPPSVTETVEQAAATARLHHGALDTREDAFLSKLSKKNSSMHGSASKKYADQWAKDNRKAPLEDEQKALQSVTERRENAQGMTNAFYDIVTDFYEYGWGDSFHFARTCKGDSFIQSIRRHEDYLASKLQLDPSKKALDVGCGVGGPLREMVRFSGAHITGLNNNAYQIERCLAYAKKFGLQDKCDFIKGDFLKMPAHLSNHFDAVFAVEATVHAPKLEQVYSEMARVLKPGGLFATYEWTTTPKYDPTNAKHAKIVYEIERGDSIPRLSTQQEALEALQAVGLELIEAKDLAVVEDEGHVGWYKCLEGAYSYSGFRMTPVGRNLTWAFTNTLETLRLAPQGTAYTAKMLNDAADHLVLGGQEGIFTPMFLILARKPLHSATNGHANGSA